MNIFKKHVEKQIDKSVNVLYDCFSDGKSHELKAKMFFKFEKDVIIFDCPVCKMELTFKYKKHITDKSTKRSKSMHFSTLIE